VDFNVKTIILAYPEWFHNNYFRLYCFRLLGMLLRAVILLQYCYLVAMKLHTKNSFLEL
jgi:hypothetical protein